MKYGILRTLTNLRYLSQVKTTTLKKTQVMLAQDPVLLPAVGRLLNLITIRSLHYITHCKLHATDHTYTFVRGGSM